METARTLDAALKSLGIPVSRAYRKVSNAPPQYITYQLIVAQGDAYSDNDNAATIATWRVDLFSREPHDTLTARIVAALKAAKFYGVTVEAEQYENDTGYYHVSFNAKILKMEV